jgi:hypothetical protein
LICNYAFIHPEIPDTQATLDTFDPTWSSAGNFSVGDPKTFSQRIEKLIIVRQFATALSRLLKAEYTRNMTYLSQ